MPVTRHGVCEKFVIEETIWKKQLIINYKDEPEPDVEDLDV